MNVRSFASHLVVAALALGVGWVLATGLGDGKRSSRIADHGTEPIERFAAALRIDDPGDRAVALHRFFAETPPEWAPRLRAEVNTAGSEIVLDEMAEALFATWWARADPEAAFANRVDPAWAGRHPWLRAVFHEWARRDPTAAIRAIRSLPENAEAGRLEATRVVVDEWFAQEDFADPAPLVELLPHLEVKPRARAVKRILETMIEARGLDATERFVEAVPDDSESLGIQVKPELMARLGTLMLDHDLERAVRWADRHGKGRKGSGIRKHLAFQWGLRDGPAAMAWATGLPDSPERPAIIKRAWLSFNRKQPERAREWLAAHEPTRALQGIYAEYLLNVAQKDPDRALALATSATDAEIRERMLTAVGRGWMQANPEAAQAWLPESGLSPAQIEKIRDWAEQAARNRRAS